MNTRKQFSSAAIALLFAIVLVLMASATSFAQGRGYGRGRGRGPDLFKKCGKFVNCHDAREGGWDRRGANRRAGLSRYGIFNPRGNRVGDRSYSTNDYWRRRHSMYRRENLNDNWRYRRYRRENLDNNWRHRTLRRRY